VLGVTTVIARLLPGSAAEEPGNRRPGAPQFVVGGPPDTRDRSPMRPSPTARLAPPAARPAAAGGAARKES